MKNQMLDGILTLLSVVVLIDRKIRQEEVEKLCDEVLALVQENDPELFYTKSMVTDWFKRNRHAIEQNVKFENQISLANQIISNVENFSDKPSLFRAMLRIAHIDGEYHATESTLMRLAAERWAIKEI